jgi:general secretion pathway protein L
MKRNILGIDINDCFLSAVVVEQSGQEKRVLSCASVGIDRGVPIGEKLPELLEQVSWSGGACACGVSLSGASLRNLSIPFTEKSKINQVLPFELEDQLITPVSDQVVEYSITGISDNSSHVLVASVEKKILRQHLESLQSCGLEPDVLTLRIVALAEQLLQNEKTHSNFLLLDAGLHSISILIVHQGRIVFMRHLPYPERMFAQAPFIFANGRTVLAQAEEAALCISSLCEDIKRSISFFQLETGLEVSPDQIVLTGCMVHVDDFQETLGSEFGQDIAVTNIEQETKVSLDDSVGEKWDFALHDHALSLALSGLRKKQFFNFRKDEFAPPGLLVASRRNLLAASVIFVFLMGGWLAYMGVDYYSLKKKHEEMGGKMLVMFKETFPERTRVKDPLLEMKASIRNIQAPSIATPVFSGDQRALNILADISGRIPGSIKIEVSRLVIDQESVQVKGTTDTFNNVNIIQSNMRKSPLYEDVDIVSAAADKDGKKIRFELRMQTGGA